jgi:hypothetical protein
VAGSRQGKILVVGAVEVQDGSAGPGRIRLKELPNYSAASLHTFLAADLAPDATAKTDGLPSYAGAPAFIMIHMWSARWRPISSCLGCTASSPTSRSGRSVSITAYAASTFSPTSMSCFPLQPPPHSARRLPLPSRHCRRPRTPQLQNVDLTGSRGKSLSRSTSSTISAWCGWYRISCIISWCHRRSFLTDLPRILGIGLPYILCFGRTR